MSYAVLEREEIHQIALRVAQKYSAINQAKKNSVQQKL